MIGKNHSLLLLLLIIPQQGAMVPLLPKSDGQKNALEIQLQNSEYVIGLKKAMVKNNSDEIIYQLGKFEGMTRMTESLY